MRLELTEMEFNALPARRASTSPTREPPCVFPAPSEHSPLPLEPIQPLSVSMIYDLSSSLLLASALSGVVYYIASQNSGGSGISRGGRGPRRGAWTPEAVTFQKFCMSKRKNLDP